KNMNFPSEKYIERHSKQLVLPKWTLQLQEKISRITISTPSNNILISYLIGMGFENFHIQTENKNIDISASVPNWEEYILVTDDNSPVDIAIIWDEKSNRKKPLIATIKLIRAADSFILEAFNAENIKAI